MRTLVRALPAAALALVLVLAGGCFDPIVGASCADGFVPCQGRCVAVCTIDAAGGDGLPGSGDGGASDGGSAGGEAGVGLPGADGAASLRDGAGNGDGGGGNPGDARGSDGGGAGGTGGGGGAGGSGGAGGGNGDAGAGTGADAPSASSDGGAAADADPSAGADAPAADAADSADAGVTADAAGPADTATTTPDAADLPDAPPPIDCGMQTLCPGGCKNLSNDPDNCGGCGVSCGTGLCVSGVCQLRQAGHLVVIGHDYTVSRAGMDNVVGNAVFLAPGTSANVLAYHGAATLESIRGTDTAIQNVAAMTGRTWRKTVVAAADVPFSLAFADVLVIYAQENATDAELLMHGSNWATPLSDFVQAGKTIVVLEGSYANAGTYQIVQQANLFHANGRFDATGQTLAVLRPGDAIATRVPQTYRGERDTVWFDTVDQTVVIQVVTEAGFQPVVLHLVF
jgi:hypothetical protein